MNMKMRQQLPTIAPGIFYVFQWLLTLCLLLHAANCHAQPENRSNQNPDDLPDTLILSASELDYPPFSIVRSDGVVDGFSVQLLQKVIHEMGREVSFKTGAWSELKKDLAQGRIDVLPLVSYSLERDAVYDFSTPYLVMHGAVFTRAKGTIIDSLNDLQDKEVIVMRGDTAHEYAVQVQLTNHLILVDTFADAFTLLAAGKHDAVLAQELMGLQLIKQLDLSDIVTVCSSLDKEVQLRPSSMATHGFEQKFCFAVQEGNKKLLAALNEALAIVIARGDYDKLYTTWFAPILPPLPVPLLDKVKLVAKAGLPILLVTLIFGLVFLRRQVRVKTRYLRLEIEERKKAEKQLELSLAEKEVMLREIHHRVKNNLQVISSLLNMQIRSMKDHPGIEALQESRSRVSIMATIHEKMYQSKDLANISFNTYVASFAQNCLSLYGASAQKITFVLEESDITMGVGQAISCGLIINELLINSLKYAFPDNRCGTITVSLREAGNDMLELRVGDDGIGLPKNIELEKVQSLGLHLVYILAEDQLDGTIELNREGGTRFQIIFHSPAHAY